MIDENQNINYVKLMNIVMRWAKELAEAGKAEAAPVG